MYYLRHDAEDDHVVPPTTVEADFLIPSKVGFLNCSITGGMVIHPSVVPLLVILPDVLYLILKRRIRLNSYHETIFKFVMNYLTQFPFQYNCVCHRRGCTQ